MQCTISTINPKATIYSNSVEKSEEQKLKKKLQCKRLRLYSIQQFSGSGKQCRGFSSAPKPVYSDKTQSTLPRVKITVNELPEFNLHAISLLFPER